MIECNQAMSEFVAATSVASPPRTPEAAPCHQANRAIRVVGAPPQPRTSAYPQEREQAFWARLRRLDWQPQLDELSDPMGSYGWSEARAAAALRDYHHFLLLHFLFPEDTFALSRDADTVWHLHILDTQRYGRDCAMLFNHFLHHIPRIGCQGDRERLDAHQRHTISRLSNLGRQGLVPRTLWQEGWTAANCILSRQGVMG